MVRVPERETGLRWMFFVLGWFLFACHNFVVNTLLGIRSGGVVFRNTVTLSLVAILILCFITSWGLKRRRRWSQWTGVIACTGLFLGFPWLTPIGAAGLFLLLYKPMALESAHRQDYWDPKRQSLLVVIASTAGFLLAMQNLQMFEKYARQMGLPDHDIGNDAVGITLAGLLVFLLLVMWFHVIFHELGHALAAVMVGFRLHAINAGPITLGKRGGRFRVRFDWKRLFSGGGYLGATPVSERGIRIKQIVVVAAGPVASFSLGLALWEAFFFLAGTSLAPYWHVFAIGSVMGFYAGLTNLIPSGYTDGNMLLHLVFHTRRGDELIACLLAGQFGQDAQERHAAGDHETTIGLRRAALQRLEAGGQRNPVQLALAHAELGGAELTSGSEMAAEASFRTSLRILSQSAGNLGVEADCWIGLNRVYHLEHKAALAAESYAMARHVLEKMDKAPPPGIDRSLILAGLAELHVCAAAYEEALDPIERVLARLGSGRKHRGLRGMMLRLRTDCEMQLGRTAEGLATAEQAAALLRLGDEGEAGMATSIQELGMLGFALWGGDQTEPAVAALRECIREFEARGEPNPAARFRLELAEILRRAGRLVEAEAALPDPAALCPRHRKQYLEQRSVIYYLGGRIEHALADDIEVVRLTEEEAQPSYLALAHARSALAGGYLSAGNVEQAELLARQAYDEFSEAQHPDLADVCFTLALIGWQKERSTAGWLERGLRTLAEAPLVRPIAKARFLEATAVRLEQAGLLQDADEFRQSAAALRRKMVAAAVSV